MKTLYFNRDNRYGSSVSTPMTISLRVDDKLYLEKEEDTKVGTAQKTDFYGNKLFLKNVYKTVEEQVKVGENETITDTGKPVMMEVQKCDLVSNLPVFLEPIYDEEGNVIDTFETTNSVNEKGINNAPIIILKQKTTSKGNLLWWEDVFETKTTEVFDKVEETTEETETPIMEDVYKKVVKNTDKHITSFRFDEVLGNWARILADLKEDQKLIGTVLDEALVNRELSSNVNTGNFICCLQENGEAVIQKITLDKESTVLEWIPVFPLVEDVDLYFNDQLVEGNKLQLETPTNELTIKFVNNSTSNRDVQGFVVKYY